MSDSTITHMKNGKTEIPADIIEKYKMTEESTIEWNVARNGEVILHIRPKVILGP